VVGADAEVYAKEIEKAVDGQSGTGKQCECEGELADDKGLAQAMAACSDAGAIALFKGLAGIDAGGVPGWRAAEEKAGERGGCEGEEQNWNVEVEISLVRQGAARHDGHEALEHGVANAYAEEASGDR
jgi:hypothetical protein